MAEQAGIELWRDPTPIVDPLTPDAQSEVRHQFASVEGERYHVAPSETVGSRPLWTSRVTTAGPTSTGISTGSFDVHDHLASCREHDDRVGIGAGYVDTLIR